MMVFADTSYYLALHNARDEHHEAALGHAHASRGEVATTEFVLAEVGNALSNRLQRALFVALSDGLLSDPLTLVVPASSDEFRRGLALFRSFPDKDWSIVDCISFAVMKRLRIREALTADRHFEQAGFRALLRRARRPRA